jgi:hypothetical protein
MRCQIFGGGHAVGRERCPQVRQHLGHRLFRVSLGGSGPRSRLVDLLFGRSGGVNGRSHSLQ